MLGLLAVLFISLQFDGVQTFFAHRLTGYLSSELKTKVSIEKVSIRFATSVVLKNVYVEDQHGDTLLYAGELVASIQDVRFKARHLNISKVTLRNGNFNLIRYKSEIHDNLHFLTEYFSSADTTKLTPASSPWDIRLKALTMENMNFKRAIEDDTTHSHGVNFSDLDIHTINGNFSNFSTLNDSIFVRIDHLSFSDKSGFKVDEFAAEAKVSNEQIRLQKLIIHTPNTNVSTDLTLNFNSFNDFDEFIHNIHWSTDFRQSTVSFKDIAYFATDLYGMDQKVKLDGLFKGNVNKFKGRNVSISWGKDSYFHGNVAMDGLPNFNETYIDILADEIRTNRADIEIIPVPPFDKKEHVSVPDNLAQLGSVRFKGKFTGFPNDFVAYGLINTKIGSISSDLNLKYNEHIASYFGHLSANNFDLGKIAMLPDLGIVTFSADVKGSGLQLDDISAILKGKVDILTYKKYAYRNISLDGQIAKKLFSGSFSIKDENADIDFTGAIDYRKKLPEFNFNAEIHKAHLDTLNLVTLNGETALQTSISTHFTGNKPDNIVGSILIDSTNFIIGKKLYHLNEININSEKSGTNRTIDINSDILDAHFAGEFEFATILDAFKEIIPRFLPSVILPRKSFSSNQNFSYNVNLKNINLISEIFLPNWDFSPNTLLKGNFNSIDHKFVVRLNSPYITYKKFTLNDLHTTATAGVEQLNVRVMAASLFKDEISLVDFPDINAVAQSDKVNFMIGLADQDSFPNRAHLEGEARFKSASSFSIDIDSSFIVVNGQSWKLDAENKINFDSSGIQLSHLRFARNNQELSFDGKISKDTSNILMLNMNHFDLASLNQLVLKTNATRLGGIVSGNVELKDIYEKVQIQSDLTADNLSLNGDTLGNAEVKLQYNSNKEVIATTIQITKGTVKIVDVNGNYFLNKEDNLDFTVKLNGFYLHTVERYISDILSDINGKASANLKLTGSLNKPIFTGDVELLKTSLVINYLKTRYSFNAKIKVKENEFVVDDLLLVDVNNNEAHAYGSVYHDYFHNFRFDINLRANKFQVLNTTLRDNGLYYGVANASGYAHFEGPIQNINMDISLSPERGTVINIPLNTASDLSQSEFITFIDRTKDTSSTITRTRVDLSGVRLNMNLDMNPNALINIIFDEKIGDVISGSGYGSLRLDINTAGDFNMYGNYTITRGDYLFTLQNLINKKFTIEPGGQITWSGEPYEATVDISAVYELYTSSLYNVYPVDSTYKRRLPVDCKLILTNKLMNPTISYEINVRNLPPSDQAIIKTILNNEQEINKQMFGLLVLNQFVPPSTAGQIGKLDASAGAGANASELLSNQVSNWLGQLSKDVVIGFNYRARDTYSSQELQLMFSKTLFNDRLKLEGNVGYLNGSQATVNSNVVGDFSAEYKLGDGRFSFKGFNRSNADNIINYSQSPYTQGLGFFYRQEFGSWKDLMRRMGIKSDDTKPK